MSFFSFLPSRGVGARNAGKRVVVSHALAVEGGGGCEGELRAPNTERCEGPSILCERESKKKSQYEFRCLAGLKTLQKACALVVHDYQTVPMKRCVEIFYFLGFCFKDDRPKTI